MLVERYCRYYPQQNHTESIHTFLSIYFIPQCIEKKRVLSHAQEMSEERSTSRFSSTLKTSTSKKKNAPLHGKSINVKAIKENKIATTNDNNIEDEESFLKRG
jgi:hypothetical protein